MLLGPFNEFLLRPALGDALQRVGAAVRYAGSLGGRAAGLTDAELAAIAAGAPLDRETVFELTTLVGYYATLALQMRVFRV